MQNFEFYAPTRMIFGKDTHKQVGKLVKEYGFKKVFVHFGGASAKKSGLLDTVLDALKAENIDYVTLGGVQANPTLAMAKEGIELGKKEGVDFILAVGGGSVIDSAKCIADGIANPDVDVWKFYMKEETPKAALPVGVILTLSATGSEMSASSVITNTELGLKRGFNSPGHRPLFSICNPELTYTVSPFQTGCGAVDIMMHTLERYFSIGENTPLSDRIEMCIRDSYDSYFTGFQDDNAAVAMMLGIARTFIDMGYKPRKTLVFCAMAAEEWGVVDSKYDWSTGAYEQVFTAHPEWQGKVIADFNFELPAHAHGKKDAVRCTYEYASFMKKATEHIQPSKEAYPEGMEVHFPIQTWSDDFSIAIAGIPSSVNEFSDGEFMETHYHSQFDNEDFYDEPVYRFHHNLYGKLVLAFDYTAVVPMDFERLFTAVEDSVEKSLCEKTQADETNLLERLNKAKELGRQLYSQIQKINDDYKSLLESGKYDEAKNVAAGYADLNSSLLYIFRKEQDYFVRLNWHDDVLFPQQGVGENLKAIYKALACLKEDDPEGALEAVYEIDNNRYAFLFDREVFRYFTEYVLNQPADRLKWGYGRIIHHENLYDLVVSLKKKNKLQKAGERPDLEEEYKTLLQAAKAQEQCYRDDIDYMASSVEKLLAAMEGCLEKQ